MCFVKDWKEMLSGVCFIEVVLGGILNLPHVCVYIFCEVTFGLQLRDGNLGEQEENIHQRSKEGLP